MFFCFVFNISPPHSYRLKAGPICIIIINMAALSALWAVALSHVRAWPLNQKRSQPFLEPWRCAVETQPTFVGAWLAAFEAAFFFVLTSSPP